MSGDYYREAYHEMETKFVKVKVALMGTVEALRGYRRERNDGNPCDAEKRAVALLKQIDDQLAMRLKDSRDD